MPRQVEPQILFYITNIRWQCSHNTTIFRTIYIENYIPKGQHIRQVILQSNRTTFNFYILKRNRVTSDTKQERVPKFVVILKLDARNPVHRLDGGRNNFQDHRLYGRIFHRYRIDPDRRSSVSRRAPRQAGTASKNERTPRKQLEKIHPSCVGEISLHR